MFADYVNTLSVYPMATFDVPVPTLKALRKAIRLISSEEAQDLAFYILPLGRLPLDYCICINWMMVTT